MYFYIYRELCGIGYKKYNADTTEGVEYIENSSKVATKIFPGEKFYRD